MLEKMNFVFSNTDNKIKIKLLLSILIEFIEEIIYIILIKIFI